MKRAVDSEDIELAEELLEVLNTTSLDLLLSRLGEVLVVIVKELLGLERDEALKDAEADAAGTEGSDDLVLEVVGVLGLSGDGRKDVS